MAGSAPPNAPTVESPSVNLPEIALALGHFSLRRAQRLAALGSDLIAGRQRPGELVLQLLDGNESDLEELTLRWRLAGLRWPIVILVAFMFVAGVNAGRRTQRGGRRR